MNNARHDLDDSDHHGGASGSACRGCVAADAANAVALEHAIIALVRGLAILSPAAAETVPETMRVLAKLTGRKDPAHALASRLTDELASRLSLMVEDWSSRQSVLASRER